MRSSSKSATSSACMSMEASGWEADLKQEWCRALGMMHEGKEDATERQRASATGGWMM